MYTAELINTQKTDLKSPVRNHYFYGKLLDTYHFQLETNYLNSKRWLLNRLVTGYGVVCGMDVKAAADGKGIIITSGLAIDKFGREIIIPSGTGPVPIPPELIRKSSSPVPVKTYGEAIQKEDKKYIHLLICYHECESDPAPVLAENGCSSESCEPSTIREKYKFIFKSGAVPPASMDTCLPDFVSGGRVDYSRLAKYITKECRRCPDNPCIPLANIQISTAAEDECHPEDHDIDITIRPIVLANDLLFEILLSLLHEDTYRGVK